MKHDRSHLTRREILSIATSALGLAFLPALRRTARAAPGPSARADQVLIINLVGGIRSSAAFHASPSTPYNPFGLVAGTGTPFALGGALDDGGDDVAYTLGPAWQHQRLPRLREIATQFSVVGTYSTARGDHLRARIEEPTGAASGAEPGILTRIGAGLAAAMTSTGAPAFHLAPTSMFGAGSGPLTKHVPVSLAGVHSVPSAASVRDDWSAATGRGFATDEDMRDRLDQRAIAQRGGHGLFVTETLGFHRRAARGIGERLSQDDFALSSPSKDGAALGTVRLAGSDVPLTNGMLKQLFLLGAPPVYTQFALNLVLAVRMLQIGSPAVTVESPTFDFHSGERVLGPPLYGYLGRAWAALRWLLARVAAPGGGFLLDRTLVTTMSEFGRDRAGASGFNAGDGSDHGADHACYYLANAVMGAGVVPNKLVGPADPTTYNAMQSSVRYAPAQQLVTILDALGLDVMNEAWGMPSGGAPIVELWT